ncbi:uncharacterized protein LOC62_04G006613 [Vanrija pseudolonga]|uniref:Uncharacterized protein n=1 Tax=Vanrija pseudolonga TaxID=143232 RepID=A0AAF0YBX3_9TREE|nr:hypothetical protein LOC62_04G006613 [Vanrija pseudolonga]
MVATKFLVAAVSALALGVQASPIEERQNTNAVDAFSNNSPLNNYYSFDQNSGTVTSKNGDSQITKNGPENLITSDDNNPLIQKGKRGVEDPAYDPSNPHDPAEDPTKRDILLEDAAKRDALVQDKRTFFRGLSGYYGYNVYNWGYGRYLYAPNRWVGNYYGFWGWNYWGSYYNNWWPNSYYGYGGWY